MYTRNGKLVQPGPLVIVPLSSSGETNTKQPLPFGWGFFFCPTEPRTKHFIGLAGRCSWRLGVFKEVSEPKQYHPPSVSSGCSGFPKNQNNINTTRFPKNHRLFARKLVRSDPSKSGDSERLLLAHPRVEPSQLLLLGAAQVLQALHLPTQLPEPQIRGEASAEFPTPPPPGLAGKVDEGMTAFGTPPCFFA